MSVSKKQTSIEHRASLNIYNQPYVHRKTSIICTLGPKTQSPEMITELRKAGMNIARLNFSHGSHEYHLQTIKNIRKSQEDDPLDGKLIAIALDTKGPEIRTGVLESGDDAHIVAGEQVVITTNPENQNKCSANFIFVDYPNIVKVIEVGGLIYIDDGLISLRVIEIGEDSIKTVAVNSGLLGSKKGVNLPDVSVDLPTLSEKDKADLRFGVENGVDMIFASFIRKADDIIAIRQHLGEEGKEIRIIAKIENHEGVHNFLSILNETDGVMVARGDLGIEIAPEKVFLAQKMMIANCNMVGKPVICATQMLESMTVNPRPTRAEVSDVANAVLDGADCVMLSGETAKGKYPLEAVRIMSNICREAESAFSNEEIISDLQIRSDVFSTSETMALAAVTTTLHHDCAAIITLTNTGESVRLISKYRPACPILVVSRKAKAVRSAHLYRGCFSFEYPKKESTTPWQRDVEERITWAMEKGKELGYIKSTHYVVVVNGLNLPDGRHLSISNFQLRIVP